MPLSRRRKRKYPSKYILPNYPDPSLFAEIICFLIVAVVAIVTVGSWMGP